MNKYDDIKQFKDKIDMHDIDYKEISEKEVQADAFSWPLIKQLASQDNDSFLENGRTTQPTPQLVSATEFAEPDVLNVMSEPRAINSDPLLNTEVTNRPAAMRSLFPAPPVAHTLAPQPVNLNEPAIPQVVSKPILTTQFSSSPTGPLESGKKTEFKNIFSQKEPPKEQVVFAESARDIPLQTLLESIALCR
ncbi:cellulose biosynthesis protein BcsO [Yersinia sp. 1652 StPb PI]|uniref:cellulose biosynthesis protein BcsO n=1 Tax=Yersinia sp. 1652 StPb PI TaxID=3061649 RepID=UPI00355B7C0E